MGRKRVKKTCNSCTSCKTDQGKAGEDKEAGTIPVIEDFDESFASEDGVTPVVEQQAVTGPDSPEVKVTPSSTQSVNTKAEKKINKRVDRLENMLGEVVTGMSAIQTQMGELTGIVKVNNAKRPNEVTQSKDQEKGKEKDKEKEKSTFRSWDSSDSSSDDETAEEGKKAELKRKERNRYKHKNFVKRGEAVQTFESLMVVTFRTMFELLDNEEDVMGMVRHGLLLSEKASKAIYIPDAMLGYDEEVRRRAGRKGPDAFGKVIQEDVMRHFSV